MKRWLSLLLLWELISCVGPKQLPTPSWKLPDHYPSGQESQSLAQLQWRSFLGDPVLAQWIDTALAHNQELRIIAAELEIQRNEVRARQGEYLPQVSLGLFAEGEKPGRYTRFGALEHQLEIRPAQSFPEPFSHYEIGLYARWEVDIWKRLRNARKVALLHYLASQEGRHWAITQLVAEIAETYYEWQAAYQMLQILDKYTTLLANALQLVRANKQAGRATQLAVNRFEAKLLQTQNRRYALQQQLIERENRLYFLAGRLPGSMQLLPQDSLLGTIDTVWQVGLPADLLRRRPDVRQAELALEAAQVNIAVARAAFYPTLSLSAGWGTQAFLPTLLSNPESILYRLAADSFTPLINRNALKAAYASASAQGQQALARYEQVLLQAYLEVLNHLAHLQNLTQSRQLKQQEVDILTQATTTANLLYKAGEADYLEVLLTQTEALEAQLELVEIEVELLRARVGLYRALGGGW